MRIVPHSNGFNFLLNFKVFFFSYESFTCLVRIIYPKIYFTFEMIVKGPATLMKTFISCRSFPVECLGSLMCADLSSASKNKFCTSSSIIGIPLIPFSCYCSKLRLQLICWTGVERVDTLVSWFWSKFLKKEWWIFFKGFFSLFYKI